MQDTATLIAHIIFNGGAHLNISTVLRNLDSCLDEASHGAYSLVWDCEEVMVAEFSQTKVILVVAPQVDPMSGFTLTIAVSPKDEDAIANPALARFHRNLALELVDRFEQPANTRGVMWQRAEAPISAEAVERITDALAENLAQLSREDAQILHGAAGLNKAPILPASALALQSAPALPI